MRVWQTGFELNNIASELYGTIGVSSSANISSTTKRTGSYSLRIGSSSTSNLVSGYYVFPSTMTQARISVHIYSENTNTNNTVTRLLAIRDSSTNILLDMRTKADGTAYGVYINGSIVGSEIAIQKSIWAHWGIDIKKHASAGWVYVYKDGVLVASMTGNTASTAMYEILLGTYPGVGSNSWASNNYAYYDDLTIDNSSGATDPTEVEDVRWDYKVVTADGTYTQWTPSTGSNHYALIDEIPPVATDKVIATIPGLIDSFTISPYTLDPNATIISVVPTVIAEKGSTDVLIATGIGLSGTFQFGSYTAPPTSLGLSIYNQFLTNPQGNSWNQNDITNMQIAIMSSGTYT